MLNKYKLWSYVVLVKAEKMLLEEEDREFEWQTVVPENYKIAIAEKLTNEE